MVKYKEFEVGDLFEIKPTKSYKARNAELISKKGNNIIISNSSMNNGIIGKTLFNPTEKGNIITFSDTTIGAATFFYQPKDFVGYAHVQGMYPKWNFLNEKRALYLISILKRAAGAGWSYGNKFRRTIVVKLKIMLPITDTDEIDFAYMERYVAELEQQRLAELDSYLKVTSLNDYKLTDDDKQILSTNHKFARFKLGKSYFYRGKTISVSKTGIFDIVPTKKKINANSIEFTGHYPYVARGEGKNGVRGYIDYDEEFLNLENTISFGQDTATMYYQEEKYFTGDKIQIFKLSSDYGELNELVANYLITAAKKAFTNFSWGQQSFSLPSISQLNIYLPVTKDGLPDFDYMEKYIRAIEKLTIKDVVMYKDKVISATSVLVNKPK